MPTAIKSGRAWVNGNQRTIVDCQEIKEGKDKGRMEVTMSRNQLAVIDKDDIINWPETVNISGE
jgi:hypothetical protein